MFQTYKDYVPLNDVVSEIVKVANNYGMMGEAFFFEDEREIENIIQEANTLIPSEVDTASTEKLLDANRNVLGKDVKKDFLIRAYGTAVDVRLKVEKEASIALFNSMIIDRINGRTVSSVHELNNNIRNYQQELFDNVISYLKDYYLNAPGLGFDISIFNDTTMYKPDEQGNIQYTGIVNRLDSIIQKQLARDNFPDGILEKLSTSEKSEDQNKLKAYNSWQILTHFDSFMKIRYGEAIEITDFGDMRFTGENKYNRSAKGTNNNTNWRNSDEIKLNEEVDNIIQELVNTTPLLTYETDTQIGYLDFATFSDILGRIKECVYDGDDILFDDNFIEKYEDSLSLYTQRVIKDKSFKQIINSIRLNPQKYLSALFELLSNQRTFDAITSDTGVFNKFRVEDKNVIYSIHKGITSSYDLTAVNAIVGSDKTNTIYEEMAQACDSIFKINFLQYYKGQDGLVKVRNMNNTRLDTLLRSIRQAAKAKNNKLVPGQCVDNGNDTYIIKGTTITYKKNKDGNFNGIEFNIPNTPIKVEVNIDGKVSYNVNGKNATSLTLYSKSYDKSDLFDFINNVLGQNISETTLENMQSSQLSTNLTNLINFASRILFNSIVSNVTLKGFNFVTTIKSRLSNVFGENHNYRIDKNMKEIDLIHSSDINTIESLANAIAIEQGLLSSSQIKSGSGSAQSQQSLSRLLGGIQSQFSLQNKSINSATKNAMILDTKLLKGVYTAREYYDLLTVRDHTKFNVNEFETSMFLYDFIGGLIPNNDYNRLIGNGTIALIPSVNSDKNTIGRILIDLNYRVKIGNEEKALRDLTPIQLEGLICRELGDIYRNVKSKINSDFNTVLAGTQNSLRYTQNSFDDFNERHKIVDPETGKVKYDSARALNRLIKDYNLRNRHKPISITDQIHFITNKDGSISPNKNILQYIDQFVDEPQYIGEITQFHQFMNHKRADVLGTLLRSNFKVDLTENTPITTYLKEQNKNWIDDKHGELILGRVKINGVEHDIRTKTDLIRVKQKLLEHFNSELVNLGKEVEVNNYIGLKKKVGQTPEDLAKIKQFEETDLIRNYNTVVSIINKFGNSDLLYEPQTLTDLDDFNVEFELNPLIDQYNTLDYLFTQEFMISTVGTLAAHPLKKSDGNIEHDEAGRFQAQHKRNVSMTATMQEFALGLINGIPTDYNIAVIDDVKDVQYNVTGDIDDGIKPFDGATFVNPFIVHLENNSLGAAKAGITKKQFVHFYDEGTANGGIIKTAGFGLTNDWIRTSPFMERMMYKMTQGKWFGPNGEPVVVDILGGIQKRIQVPYYFRKGNKYYKVTQIVNKGNNRYDVFGGMVRVYNPEGTLKCELTRDVDETEVVNLNNLFTEDVEGGVLVDSNYSLWNLFGGKNSVEVINGKLVPSEFSIKNVVTAMNTIGLNPNTGAELTEEEIANVRTQDDVYQPLKHSDIHYIPTVGAVKQGAANINTKDLFFDNEPLNFMKIHMYQAGIQLDKEHHADGSELSLMTQVMNACAHKGFSLDDSMEMYKALRTLTDIGTGELLEPIKEYINDENVDTQKAIVEATVNTVVKALARQSMSENDLLSVFASELIDKVKTGQKLKTEDFLEKLPKDNPAVYAKFLSTVSVFLTNSGIKMKIPGILSVLTPSYNIMQMYTIPKGTNPDGSIRYIDVKYEQLEYNEDGISAKEYLQAIQQNAPVVLETTLDENGQPVQNINFNYLEIGKTYIIDGKSVQIKTPRQRSDIKRSILQGAYTSIVQDLTVGHELGNYDVLFKGNIGENSYDYSLWDLDSVRALFDLKEILDEKDFLKQQELYSVFKHNYGHLLPNGEFDFKQLEKYLRKLVRQDNLVLSENGSDFTDKQTVLIDGQEVLVNKTSIKSKPYELILPKIFINEFGLDQYDQLTDIANDPDFFTYKLINNIKPTADESNYSIALLNGSKNKFTGKLNHYYIATYPEQINGLTELKIDKFSENGNLYRIDSDGNQIHSLSSQEDKIYIDSLGNEIIYTKNPGFYVNHLNYTTAKISETSDPEFTSAELFKVSKNKSAKRFYQFLTQGTVEDSDVWDEEALTKLNTQIIKEQNSKIDDIIDIDSDNDHPLANYLKTLGREMHSSFLKSLETVASRTPSQSMQSFMPMKIVAFDNPNINTAFVSTAQIWLQGSDYDIDAVSIAAYDIDKSGRLPLWSPYADLSSL